MNQNEQAAYLAGFNAGIHNGNQATISAYAAAKGFTRNAAAATAFVRGFNSGTTFYTGA